MASQIPSIEIVREQLLALGHAQMQKLSDSSGVPFTTLWKVRNGPTDNPGIETVRKFWPLIAGLRAEAEKAAKSPA